MIKYIVCTALSLCSVATSSTLFAVDEIQKIDERISSDTRQLLEEGLQEQYGAHLLKCFSSGGTAVVCLAENSEENKYYAIKIQSQNKPNIRKYFENEISIFRKKIEHPNIVRAKSSYLIRSKQSKSSEYAIVLEFCPGGDLRNYLHWRHQNPTSISNREMAKILRSLAAGLSYLHSQGITHYDIKPANVLLPDSDFDHLKITDFGHSKISGSRHDGMYGTIPYMPLEALDSQGKKIDPRSDLWSLGILLLVACGIDDFPVKCDEQTRLRDFIETFNRFAENGSDYKKAFEAIEAKFLIPILQRLLEVDVNQRSSDEELEQLIKELPNSIYELTD